jgi:aspartate aminotransferase
MTTLNQQLNLIRQSPTVAMADRVAELKAQGKPIIALQTGDPDFSTPLPILEVAFKAMQDGLTHYAPSRGLVELRRAIVAKVERDTGVSYDPETELLVTHGGIHAYYVAMQAALNPGDDVLIPDPDWGTHANMITMLRGRAIRVPAPAENGFIPPLAAWERALTPKTRVIVISYPSNPTGAYPSKDYLAGLHEFAAAHNLWIISDEVYENLYYGDSRPVSAAAFAGVKDRTLVINSFSKTYAMTGWRVGYLTGPASAIENALKAGQNSITCVAPFIQKAATFALTDPDMRQAALDMRAAYTRRRELALRVANEYHSTKVKVIPPLGAFYFFLDMRALGLSSLEICERLLDESLVGLVPGAAFGEQGEGFVRMTIAASDTDVEAGMKAILEWAECAGKK